MSLIVQKFGGTSVGTIERIQSVARWALDTQAQGHQVVVVVSAMSGETNRLVQLATQINPIPYSCEYDLLIASGEQVSVGLVTLAINTEAQRRMNNKLVGQGGNIKKALVKANARGFLGHQIGIFTDSVFSKARIQQIDTTLLRKELALGVIPVIAGFQGVDANNNITTLGRGGSDTSAVAIAAALGADECEIYTDVEGVYTTDPRLCPEAKKISKISYEEMMELAGLGAKVLQIRSVELAAKYKISLHVRSSFNAVHGTRVVAQQDLGGRMEQVLVSGVAADVGQVQFTLQNLPAGSEVVAQIFQALSRASIVVDIIVQDTPSAQRFSLGFTIGKSDALNARLVLDKLKSEFYAEMKIFENRDLAKVSVVGVGMQHHPGVAAKMFSLLAESRIEIKMISTSEIKISCIIPEEKMKEAVRSLHQGFELHRFE
ncbi:MAG: aspartate kinase [Bdellovibrionia bacterium]